jgi:hypothetical protein
MLFEWTVTVNKDPRTTEQVVMLTLKCGNMVIGAGISAKTARSMAKDLSEGAGIADTGVLEPTPQEKRIFSA